jgi:hypothetical protein
MLLADSTNELTEAAFIKAIDARLKSNWWIHESELRRLVNMAARKVEPQQKPEPPPAVLPSSFCETCGQSGGKGMLKRNGVDVINCPTCYPFEEKPEPEKPPRFPYGLCPVCGDIGIRRERRPNGNDKCAKGHEYPSASAKPEPEVCETCRGDKDGHRANPFLGIKTCQCGTGKKEALQCGSVSSAG